MKNTKKLMCLISCFTFMLANATMVVTNAEETTATTYNPKEDYGYAVYGPPPFVAGDVNLDGKVSVADLVEMKSFLIYGNDANYLYNADVNDDGKISTADLLLLKKYLLGIINSFDEDTVTTEVTTFETTFETTENEVELMYGPPLV